MNNSNNLYTIRDSKCGSYNQPFPSQHDISAKRQVSMVVNAGGTLLSEFPGEYELYKCGEFDADTGKVKTIELEHICCLSSLKTSKTEEK